MVSFNSKSLQMYGYVNSMEIVLSYVFIGLFPKKTNTKLFIRQGNTSKNPIAYHH